MFRERWRFHLRSAEPPYKGSPGWCKKRRKSRANKKYAAFVSCQGKLNYRQIESINLFLFFLVRAFEWMALEWVGGFMEGDFAMFNDCFRRLGEGCLRSSEGE